jgi:adenylate kinase
MAKDRADRAEQDPTLRLGLVLIGPPHVGKGTQAAKLRDEFGLAHIATGDLLREHRERDSELGRQAAERMDAGRLVPDELVVAMVEQRIRESARFLLDGFPRTLPQAEALTDLLRTANRELTAAVLVDAPDNVVIARIAGRQDGRDDDAPETVRRRLEVFHRTAARVIAYCERLGLLRRIDAGRPIEEVYEDARQLLTTLAGDAVREASPQRQKVRPGRDASDAGGDGTADVYDRWSGLSGTHAEGNRRWPSRSDLRPAAMVSGGRSSDGRPAGCGAGQEARAALYCSSVTCSPQVTGLPESSISCIARWVM